MEKVSTQSLLCIYHDILVYISRVNSEEYHSKVESVRYSPVNLLGQNSTKSVYGSISSFFPVYSDTTYILFVSFWFV